MKQRKLADLFVVVCFLGFLALALAVTLLKPKSGWSYYENRPLARPAELTMENLWNGSFTGSVESVLQDHAAGRNTMLKLSTWTNLNVLHRPVVNQIIPTQDILLHWLPYESPNPAAITAQAQAMADQLARLRDVVEEYGGRYYYVAVPGQYAYFEDRHPAFLNNRSEYTALELPAFVQAMEERGVNLVEMGAELRRLGNPPELYSTVDYHYAFGGAYQTYLSIMERINRDRTDQLVVLEGENIRMEALPNPYMGSRSRKIFGLWDNGEKTSVGWPAKPIPFARWNNGQETEATVYTLPDTPEQVVDYTMYMGGDIAETVIDTGREELPTLLIYGDSFTNPVEGLMYYSFGQMRTIDLRHYHDMSLADYIRLYQPDVVVGIRDYEVLLSTDGNGSVF